MRKSVRAHRLLTTLVAALVASGLVTAIALANIEHAGHRVFISSTNSSFKVATAVVSCEYAFSGGKEVPVASKEMEIETPGFHNDGATSCSSAAGAATVATTGKWKIKEEGAGKAEFIIPEKGATITIPALPCTITIAPAAPFTMTKIPWTNGTNSMKTPSTISFAGNKIPISVAGAGCPAATEGEFTGNFTVADGTNPEFAVEI
jgi:hypothetical protein